MTATDTDEIAETHDGHHQPAESILTPYRGQPVMAAGVAIPNAAGGLHEALKVDPIELEIGDTVYVVLECEVRPPSYDPLDKDNYRGPLKLVNRLHAVEGTFVDQELVKAHLDVQRQRIEEAKSIEERRRQEEAGQGELPLDEQPAGNGQPEQVGDVLDDVIGTAEEAETDAAARGDRMAQLHTWSKPDLIARAGELSIAGRHDLTKAELIEQIADTEAEEGTDG